MKHIYRCKIGIGFYNSDTGNFCKQWLKRYFERAKSIDTVINMYADPALYDVTYRKFEKRTDNYVFCHIGGGGYHILGDYIIEIKKII